MVLGAILRYLANNEKLVQRLADSYPMRRAAQFLISAYYRSRAISQQNKLTEMTPNKFQHMMNAFRNKGSKNPEGTKFEKRK